jgi:hypothetical protein
MEICGDVIQREKMRLIRHEMMYDSRTLSFWIGQYIRTWKWWRKKSTLSNKHTIILFILSPVMLLTVKLIKMKACERLRQPLLSPALSRLRKQQAMSHPSTLLQPEASCSSKQHTQTSFLTFLSLHIWNIRGFTSEDYALGSSLSACVYLSVCLPTYSLQRKLLFLCFYVCAWTRYATCYTGLSEKLP